MKVNVTNIYEIILKKPGQKENINNNNNNYKEKYIKQIKNII